MIFSDADLISEETVDTLLLVHHPYLNSHHTSLNFAITCRYKEGPFTTFVVCAITLFQFLDIWMK